MTPLKLFIAGMGLLTLYWAISTTLTAIDTMAIRRQITRMGATPAGPNWVGWALIALSWTAFAIQCLLFFS